MNNYIPKEIESKWQKIWADKKSDQAPEPTADKPPYFILVMFPYPSGHLHMGHVRNYTIGDILARFYRRQGRSVLHPIGWDSFGLPAENAAIKNNVDPGEWTRSNINHMRGQLKELAISYDWDREVATCEPDFYHWNQWIFLKMMEKGLAYRKKAPVNWCPNCATTLANEQVHDNKCWRCDTEVIQKELEQWFFKITAYAKELLSGHDQLGKSGDAHGWPDEVLAMQKNWIGESQGAYVNFPVDGQSGSPLIKVFTTRPDTLFGATFVVLAPEHPLVEKITASDKKSDVSAYVENAKKIGKFQRMATGREKTGVFTGAFAKNPVNGKSIPVWIADYVLTDYGTGAIMAVPAHDQRDFDFATKHDIPILEVIQNPKSSSQQPLKEAFEEDGVLVNSGSFNGLSVEDAKQKIIADLTSNKQGSGVTTYRLRDWLLSRQRYWGTPIPVIYCPKCGAQPVPEKDLPVILPANLKFTGQGASPLKQAKDWLNVSCPKCAGSAERETDTMDTFVDSSWYYARYTDPKNKKIPFSAESANKWIPVHQYVGGIEHACMHLIYSRFFHKVLRDLGFLNSDEPFRSLLTQGMVTLGGTAMSKSKGNVVDPKDVIDKFGTDTCRMFTMFAAPPTQQLEWSDSQVEGIWRFLNRVWRLAQSFLEKDDARGPKRSLTEESKTITKEELIRITHQSIHRVTNDIKNEFGFNTSISRIMELVNAMYLYPTLGDETSRDSMKVVLHLLQPFAPHLTEEIWSQMKNNTLLAEEPWPKADKNLMKENEVEIVIQVNGKLKERLKVATHSPEEDVKSQALRVLTNRGLSIEAKRVIYVPQKLVNFVTGGK